MAREEVQLSPIPAPMGSKKGCERGRLASKANGCRRERVEKAEMSVRFSPVFEWESD